MADDDVDVKFGASLEGLQAGVEEAKKALEGLTEPISGIMDAFSELGEALIAAFAIEKIVDFAKEMGELGESTERMSKILGISTEQVGELNFAAALTGTSTENLAMMIGRFESGLSKAEDGTGRLAAGLRSLGLSAEELQKMNPSQQLREIAEATAKVGDGAAKAAALNDLGRGFVQLIPLLDEGGEGFDELKEKADAAGVALSPELTSKLVEMQHGLVGLKENIEGATIGGFTPFIGVVNNAVGGMSGLVTGFTDSVNHGGLMKQMLDILADGFRIVESAVNDLVAGLKVLGAVATYSITVAVDKALELGNTLSAVAVDLAHLDPSFSHVAAVAHRGAQDATDAWNEMRKSIAAAMAENDEAAHKIWKGSPLAAKAGSLFGFHLTDPRTGEGAGVPTGGSDSSFKPPPPMPVEQTKGKADNSAFKDAQEEAAHWIKIWTEAASNQEAILDGELKRHEITDAQWLAGTKDALADELQDTIATYQAELATANLTAQQRKAISDKMAEAGAANAVKVTKAEQKAADDMFKSWQNAADKVASVMDSQVDSLLRGTETFAQAFQNMFVSAIEDIIKELIKMAVEMAFIKTIMPAVGGGSGGPLGTLFHAIGIPGFAEGTDYVPQTGIAMLHQGERIIPANQNNGGRGGDTYHTTHNYGGIYSNASDPREVAREVARQWDSQPTLRPKY